MGGFIKKLRQSFKYLAAIGGAFILALLFWPVPIEPEIYETGAQTAGLPPFEHNNALAQASLIPLDGDGPEGIARGADGRLYTGLIDGRIIAFDEETGDVETLANTGGRPLALMFDANGHLVICDAIKGLISMSPDGAIRVLVDEYDGQKMIFVDALDIGSDGKIWFSDASQRFDIHAGFADIIESQSTGRIFSFDPRTQQTTLEMDGLAFANGVVLSPDEDFLLVNETYRYRIWRYWLTGAKAGQKEVFVDNLPGYPDNITPAPNGHYWVAIPTARDATLDAQSDKPFIRKILYRIDKLGWLSPSMTHSFAVLIGPDGQVKMSLDAKNAAIQMVTNIEEMQNKLYISSLTSPHIGILPLPKAK